VCAHSQALNLPVVVTVYLALTIQLSCATAYHMSSIHWSGFNGLKVSEVHKLIENNQQRMVTLFFHSEACTS
jgi:hypothetical protein